MGHGHTTEHHMIAGAKTVHVVAVAKSDIHVLSQNTFGAGKILGPGDFDIVAAALGDGHR